MAPPGVHGEIGRSQLYIISGPSGAGKGTIVQGLLARRPDLVLSVSYTTRPPRPMERDGVHYHFVTHETFALMRQRGEFVESAEVHGNHYGTSRKAIEQALAAGRDVLLEIDVQGAAQVKRQIPGAVLIFIEPPSLLELEKRLRNRRTEHEEALSRRLADAYDELRQKRSFDGVVVNDEVERAVKEVLQLMEKAKSKGA
ncbi:MAG TPA: guanylate kinase [Actinomycetota bacterium]|nr:guanylate kinase [Actinomycetota bacterium]